jgi:acetyl-coA carboxylase, biotin carboxyl carrier protein
LVQDLWQSRSIINKKDKTMNFELDYIEKLVKLVSESDLTELTLEEGEEAIVVRKEKTVVQAQTIMPQAPAAAPAQSAAPAEEKKEDAPKGKPITSPMVGTFYLASSPGAKPFVEVGATVSTGQVVCIIEAMKLMNEIESEVSGKVTQICVKDGEAVEYGQVLMYVE